MAKNSPAYAEAIAIDDDYTPSTLMKVQIDVNVSDLNPSFDRATGTLTVEIPQFRINGPIFTTEALEAFKATGMTEREVDDVLDVAINEVQILTMARLLADRCRR